MHVLRRWNVGIVMMDVVGRALPLGTDVASKLTMCHVATANGHLKRASSPEARVSYETRRGMSASQLRVKKTFEGTLSAHLTIAPNKPEGLIRRWKDSRTPILDQLTTCKDPARCHLHEHEARARCSLLVTVCPECVGRKSSLPPAR